MSSKTARSSPIAQFTTQLSVSYRDVNIVPTLLPTPNLGGGSQGRHIKKKFRSTSGLGATGKSLRHSQRTAQRRTLGAGTSACLVR